MRDPGDEISSEGGVRFATYGAPDVSGKRWAWMPLVPNMSRPEVFALVQRCGLLDSPQDSTKMTPRFCAQAWVAGLALWVRDIGYGLDILPKQLHGYRADRTNTAHRSGKMLRASRSYGEPILARTAAQDREYTRRRRIWSRVLRSCHHDESLRAACEAAFRLGGWQAVGAYAEQIDLSRRPAKCSR